MQQSISSSRLSTAAADVAAMKSSTQHVVALVLSLACAVHGQGLELELEPGSGATFSVQQVVNPDYVRSVPNEMARTLTRFGKPIPQRLAGAAGHHHRFHKRQAAQALPQPYDSQYLVNVSIGTPPQVVPLDFDTGSADLWVIGSVDARTTGQKSYNSANSNTSKQLTGSTWSIKYGDGSTADGNVYMDVVSLGGLTVEQQAVEVALSEAQSFEDNKNLSGLLGLAFSSLNQVTPNKQKTWFANVKSQLALPLFSVNLQHNARAPWSYHHLTPSTTAGAYDFGFIDNTSYIGNVTYTVADNSSGFWGFTANSFTVGSGAQNNTDIKAIADTGTTLMYLPTAVVQAYYAAVPGAQNSSAAGGWIFPCKTQAPSFTFGIEASQFTVPSQYMTYEPVDRTNCFGGIQDDSSIGFSIFGDVALKSFYVVFNMADSGPLLGWANKNLPS